MPTHETPAETIARLAATHEIASDVQVLERIVAIPPLADESDSLWDRDEYWYLAAYPYLALADVAAKRKLRSAVRLLLERAAYGDPGEIMRGLRHGFEAIYFGDLQTLADEYLSLARAERLGTRMWAISGLAVLDDPRAKAVFEESARSDPPMIRQIAASGLERLVNPQGIADEAARWKAELEAARQERLAKQLASDAAITSRRCAHCGNPLPSYRKTCQYCKTPAKAAE
jgi:hypothetical protein